MWESAAGYSLKNSTTLPATSPFGAGVADFNRDGYLGISVSDMGSSPDQDKVVVYWGAPLKNLVDH